MIRKIRCFMTIAATAMFGCNALAAVTAEEAKQLGGPVLTVFGAEKAGNKEGTIPPYNAGGEIVKAPPGYGKAAPGEYTDPWNEKPLFSITAQNYMQYADKLDGMKAMFKIYPNYRMDIYPTHRTANFSQLYLDNTVKNATGCKVIQNEMVLEGCYGGLPFPIPKTGAEVMWNHLLEYAGFYNRANFEGYVVGRDGNPVLQARIEGTQLYSLFDPARTTPAKGADTYWAYRGDTVSPARKAGEKLLILDPVDMLNVGRHAWQYIPGQRRVKMTPDLAYDTSSPYGGGAITIDESKGFLGALDRFDWKLLGKREKFIIYNDYKSMDYKNCPAEVMYTKDFINPDCVRWELHRVWVVEGTLKPGLRHIYHRRVYYWDEDAYSAGAMDSYDAAGKLYRLVHVISYPFYDGTGLEGGSSFHQDLATGVYASQGMTNRKGLGFYALPPITDRQRLDYTPGSLAAEGIR